MLAKRCAYLFAGAVLLFSHSHTASAIREPKMTMASKVGFLQDKAATFLSTQNASTAGGDDYKWCIVYCSRNGIWGFIAETLEECCHYCANACVPDDECTSTDTDTFEQITCGWATPYH